MPEGIVFRQKFDGAKHRSQKGFYGPVMNFYLASPSEAGTALTRLVPASEGAHLLWLADWPMGWPAGQPTGQQSGDVLCFWTQNRRMCPFPETAIFAVESAPSKGHEPTLHGPLVIWYSPIVGNSGHVSR
jgi:hypothetical protein